MRKSIWFSIALVNTLLVTACVCLVAVAVLHPFRPGDQYYVFQNSAEQSWLQLAPGSAARADIALDLAERRLADLVVAPDPARIEASGKAFDGALKDAVTLMNEAPKKDIQRLYDRLAIILLQADVVMGEVEAIVDLSYAKTLHDKIQASLISEKGAAIQQIWTGMINPEAVPFFNIEYTAEDHLMVFPLSGHARIDCMGCHIDGKYKGTTRECSQCHRSKYIVEKYMPDEGGQGLYPIAINLTGLTVDEIYPYHFPGECSDCHSTYNWTPVSFDHEGIVECQSCHAGDLPSAPDLPDATLHYYPGDCINCHEDTNSWKKISFEHEHAYDCVECHEVQVPGPHYGKYEKDCISCHQDILTWDAINFDHLKSEDCILCHSSQIPEGHYPGQCSKCHSTLSWTGILIHPANANCAECHAAPSNHYSGSCTNCHSSGNGSWAFSHPDNQGKCADCHNHPNNHEYPFGCGSCHGTQTWATTLASANHTNAKWEPFVCSECHTNLAPQDHYYGECSDCHNTSVWENYDFNHTYYNDCISCHSPETAHYPGQCSSCHVVDEWGAVNIDHNLFTSGYACSDCHATPNEHYNLQCALCHTPESAWQVPVINHDGIASLNYQCVDCHTSEENHYPGDCAGCHSTTNPWSTPNVNHDAFISLYTSCTACHAEIEGHWPGECANCHKDTGDWMEVEFDHTGYTNCKACHVRPDSHTWRGQCSNCHTTAGWDVLTAPVVVPTTTLTTTLTITIELTATAELTPTEVLTGTVETPEATTTIAPTTELPVATATPAPPIAPTPTPTRGSLTQEETRIPRSIRWKTPQATPDVDVLVWAQETFTPKGRQARDNNPLPTPEIPRERITPASDSEKMSQPPNASDAVPQDSSAFVLVAILLTSTAIGCLRHRKTPL
jgi:hypothetical protein